MEQGLPDAACVVYRVSISAYAGLYREVWGPDIDGIAFPADTDARCEDDQMTLPLSEQDRERVRLEYDRIARSISAFEASPAGTAFSSKFDAWLRGEAAFTMQEQMGFMLFQGPARCDVCHSLAGPRPVLTDFGYHNLGTPANPANPAHDADPDFVDLGLGGTGGAAPGPAQWGRVRRASCRWNRSPRNGRASTSNSRMLIRRAAALATSAPRRPRPRDRSGSPWPPGCSWQPARGAPAGPRAPGRSPGR